MITRDDLNWWLDLEARLDWRFATTYAESAPHEYVVAGRTPGLTEADLTRAAHVIRTFGEPMKFFATTRIYLTAPSGWKHWDMHGGVLGSSAVGLINRGRAEHVYGVQNAPRTASGVDSPYDGLATAWDTDHGMTVEERSQTAALLRGVFGERLGRTLDIGCGTGWPLDAGLVEAARYVAVDPSTAMLNMLVAKHPHLAGVHPMTFAEATARQVLCGTRFDTVLALGGAASYLTPDEIATLRSERTGRAVVLMHFAPEARPADVSSAAAEGALAAASALGADTKKIGRFITTVLRIG